MIQWPDMPDCGVYLVWPEEGTSWIHPEDLSQAQLWIPSTRVFRRHGFDGTYYRLEYGPISIRVKPTLWLKVPDEHFCVGDMVEIRSIFMEREPNIATISDILYDRSLNRITYLLLQRELPLPKVFFSEDLHQLTNRPELREQVEKVVIQPQPESEGD